MYTRKNLPDTSHQEHAVLACIPSVMVFVRYTGVDRAAGYLVETGMRLVLDT
jgi:hypothetical protein